MSVLRRRGDASGWVMALAVAALLAGLAYFSAGRSHARTTDDPPPAASATADPILLLSLADRGPKWDEDTGLGRVCPDKDRPEKSDRKAPQGWGHRFCWWCHR